MTRYSLILKSVLILMFLSVYLSCEGPTGPPGVQGQQGEQGLIGPAGTDGSVIHADWETPEEEIGAIGDFYLNLSNGDLYGPKSEEHGWGDPINLSGSDGKDGEDGEDGEDGKDGEDGEDGEDGQDGEDGEDGKDGEDGEDGEDGKDGSQIYSGDGPPDPGIGNDGDYYLDKLNFNLYGPKAGGAWGMAINLQGPIGIQGPPGEDGEDANTTLYNFAGHDFSVSGMIYFIEDVTEQQMQESAWLVYLVGPSGTIYHIPGYAIGTFTFYKVHHRWETGIAEPKALFSISKVGGTGDAYSAVKIVRIEAATIVGGIISSINGLPSELDVTDYHSVLEYAGLTDHLEENVLYQPLK